MAKASFYNLLIFHYLVILILTFSILSQHPAFEKLTMENNPTSSNKTRRGIEN